MKNFLISAIILFSIYINAYSQTEISTALNYQQQAFDVKKYSANIDFTDYTNKNIIGNCNILFEWVKSPEAEKFYFHLEGLTVDSVLYKGEKITFTQEENVDGSYYSIASPEDAEINQESEFKVYYHGTMTTETGTYAWGGVHYDLGVLYAMGAGMRNKYVSATRHWLACYDHPSDKAKCEFNFTVPAGIKVASNGLHEVHNYDNGTDMYAYTHDYDCATYLMNFAVSNFEEINWQDADGIEYQIFTRPETREASEYAYKKLEYIKEVFEEYFGDYPYEKIGYVNTEKGSMEHQTMISLAESIIAGAPIIDDSLNTTVAHELCHQWFGNSFSPYDFRDAWLNEGFAEFSEALLSGHHYGHEEYMKFLKKDLTTYWKNVSSDGIVSLYDFDRERSGNYPGTIYNKGSLVVAMLKQYLGDEKFFNALKEYCSRYAYSNVNTENLIAVYEEITGEELSWFFDQWVYGKGYPKLQVDIKKELLNNSQEKLNIRIEQTQIEDYGLYINFPVELQFRDKNTGEYFYKTFMVTDSIHEFIIEEQDISDQVLINQFHESFALLKYKLSTGIEENKIHFNVYPQPAINVLNIELDKEFENSELTISDLNGKVFLKTGINNILGNKYSIDVSKMPSSLYILTIVKNDKQITQTIRIIK